MVNTIHTPTAQPATKRLLRRRMRRKVQNTKSNTGKGPKNLAKDAWGEYRLNNNPVSNGMVETKSELRHLAQQQITPMTHD